jgi:hypothetical protein
MSAATAKAKSIQPDNRTLTVNEALTAISAFKSSPDCACAILWAALEAFEINLGSPIKAGGKWLASIPAAPLYAFGESPVEAVEEVLRQIGEVG